MAWLLAGVIGHLGGVTIKNGMISAAFVWFGFVLTTLAVNNTFGLRNAKLIVIDGGHWLAVLPLMGAIIGCLGPTDGKIIQIPDQSGGLARLVAPASAVA